MIRIIISLSLLSAMLFLSCFSNADSSKIVIPSDFTWKKAKKLDGNWDFYWNTLVNEKNRKPSKTTVYELPSNWTSKNKDGKVFNPFGYASYVTQLQIEGEPPKQIHFKVNRIKAAHRILVNGKEISSAGNPSTNKDTFKSDYKPYITPAIEVPDSGVLEIIIHVSNFEFYRGGVYKSIEVGTFDALNKKRTTKIFSSSLVFGAILIMGLYHILLWIKKHDNLASLTFGFFCLVMAYREMFIAERIILFLYPSISDALIVKTDLFTVYVGLPLMHLFIHFLFPKQSPSKLVYISILAAATLMLVLFFGGIYISEAAILPFEIYVLLLLLLCFYIGIRAALQKEDGALIFLLGYIAVFATAINDILHERGVIDTAFVFYIGTLVFVFSQASLISNRFAKAYVELERLKVSLEKTVNIRTQELREARDEAVKVSEQNRRLSESMTTAIESERKTIAREIHDNFNSIMVATRMQAASIYNMIIKDDPDKREIARIANAIRGNMKTSYAEARALVSRLRPETIDTLPLDAAIRELLDGYKTDKMDVIFNSSGNAEGFQDDDLKIAIYRICQEALTNIVKHADARKIEISLSMEENLVLTIVDDGKGFDTNQPPGNGLTHMKQRAVNLGGKLSIDTSEKGSIIKVVTYPLT